MTIMYKLPWPPTVNNYFTVARGRKILSSKGRQYKKDVALIARFKSPLQGRLDVAIHAYPPDKRKRDLDNLTKAILDALDDCGIYCDDSQIDKLSIERKEKGGFVLVAISEISE